MNREQLTGLWPVMITPFTQDGEIDYASLERLIAWYEDNGVTGLFAACQSSETFFLSLREREELVRFVKQHAHVPVVASGHISESVTDQIEELQRIGRTGVDALILISNRLAPQHADPQVFLSRLKTFMSVLDPEIPLGFYECPSPYKRLLSMDELKFCADSGRFYFMKDTCCDLALIRRRLDVIQGSPLRLFNANTTTLLDSLRAGAAGFSGVMMNFHPGLYAWLMQNWEKQPKKAEQLQAFLTAFALIENHAYPVNAKYYLQTCAHVLSDIHSRAQQVENLTETYRDEVRQMATAEACLWEFLKQDA